jgi:predicted MFS family arabinose efflux permease
MNAQPPTKNPPRRLLIALVIAVFATTVIDVLIPLYLVDIAKTFQVTPAIAGQIKTFSALATIIPALLMGLLVMRFKAKSLLVAGVFFIVLAALLSYLSTSIAQMQIFYSFNGIGSVLVSGMTLVIIGEFYPTQTKPQAVGALLSASTLGRAIGYPLSAQISHFGSWRDPFLLLVLPVSLVGIALVFFYVPSGNAVDKSIDGKASYWTGFRGILRNKSAVVCLVFQILFTSLFTIGTFGVAFFQETFKISTNTASAILFGAALIGAFGSFISGRLYKPGGSKMLTVVASLLSGVLAMVAFYIPALWIVLLFRYASLCLWGIATASGATLMLDQVPHLKGSMMSLRLAVSGIGAALGVAIGGLVLTLFDYQTVAFVLGAVGVAGAIILAVAAKEQQ